MSNLSLVQFIIVWAIPVLFAITVHEVSHGWVASKLGDKTALMMGRVTLNPFKHIDLIGTILVPAVLLFLGGFVFGWAKPVPVNWANLRNTRRDIALVALAGPVSNLLMALVWALLLKLGVVMVKDGMRAAMALVYMGQAGIMINLVLMVLNLIPIPPLDGSRVVSSFLPGRWQYQYNRIEPFGFFILLGLMVAGVLFHIIGPAVIFFRDTILHLIVL